MKNAFTIIALAVLGITAFAADYKPYPAVYAPVRTGDLRPYVINGVPIGSVAGDSSYVLLSLETGRIGSDRYVKVWALYQNLGGEPYLFEPLNHIKVTIETEKGSQPGLVPAPPSQLAKHIDAEEQVSAIHARYSAALRTIASEATPDPSAEPTVAPYDASDPQAAEAAAEAARARLRSAAYMYQTFVGSANNGLLRTSTVFQGKAIMGYVYVLAGDADLEKCTKITLYLTTGDGIRAVEFKPMAGE
jgi:hypothetical protein